jgi:hypothetical protein
MYWPIGTPRVHATSSSRASDANIYVSYDGLQSLSGSSLASPQPEASAQAPHDDSDDAQPPPTPITPATPAVKPVDRYEFFPDGGAAAKSQAADDGRVPLKDPVLALRIARTGQMFAVITATSITLWQTKVSFPCPSFCKPKLGSIG